MVAVGVPGTTEGRRPRPPHRALPRLCLLYSGARACAYVRVLTRGPAVVRPSREREPPLSEWRWPTPSGRRRFPAVQQLCRLRAAASRRFAERTPLLEGITSPPPSPSRGIIPVRVIAREVVPSIESPHRIASFRDTPVREKMQSEIRSSEFSGEFSKLLAS